MHSIHFLSLPSFEGNEFCLMVYAIVSVCMFMHIFFFTCVFSVLHTIIYTRSF